VDRTESEVKTVGLYQAKPWFVKRLGWIEDELVSRRVHPDTLTAGGVVAGAGVGAALALGAVLHAPLLWLMVGPLVLARLALNALDGAVARRTGASRPFGTALNETGDRVADALALGGAAFAVPVAVAFSAVVASFLASLSGVLALALIGRRDYSGPMGKADRMAVLAVGATGAGVAGSSTILAVALVVIACGSALTAALRMSRLRKAM
jgi:CDP-diacylglycerol--glycerol-3-phosphate 3-phosphatidyltransferase